MNLNRVFITGNYRKTELSEYLPRFVQLLLKKGITVYINTELKHHLPKLEPSYFRDFKTAVQEDIDVIFAFGGDGTILFCAAQVNAKEIPILGFNLGGLGFLADLNVEEFTKAIEYISHDEYKIDDRSVLELTINDQTVYATMISLWIKQVINGLLRLM